MSLEDWGKKKKERKEKEREPSAFPEQSLLQHRSSPRSTGSPGSSYPNRKFVRKSRGSLTNLGKKKGVLCLPLEQLSK
jgi:hypothetical protein